MPLRPEAGSVLRRLRDDSGLTQEKLGELSGVHATHIGRIERGESEPTLGTLVDLALALKLEPDQLVKHWMPGGSKLAIAPPLVGTETPTVAVRETAQVPSRFVVVIQRTQDGYSASVPDLPGCTASGSTPQAVETGILRAGNIHVQGLRRAGRPIPAPRSYAMAMTFDV